MNDNNLSNKNSNIQNQEFSENALIEQKAEKQPKKNKRKKKKTASTNHGINFGIGTLMLVIFCAFLLVIATFLQLDVTHFIIPMDLFKGKSLDVDDFLFTIKYIPQIPIALFTIGLLGRRYGSLSIVLYIMAGLFFLPVFALGGGLRYIFTYGFGYILAYLPAGIILGSVLKKDYTYKNVAKAVFLGVLTIHIIGILYMLIIAYFKHAGLNFATNWIVSQSGIKIIYDFIFSYLLILVAKYARIILWFYL